MTPPTPAPTGGTATPQSFVFTPQLQCPEPLVQSRKRKVKLHSNGFLGCIPRKVSVCPPPVASMLPVPMVPPVVVVGPVLGVWWPILGVGPVLGVQPVLGKAATTTLTAVLVLFWSVLMMKGGSTVT